jgi:DNA anti-recombination protein RmuC
MGAVAARDLDERLEADQARIAASLTRLSMTMESLAMTTQNAGTTLETSSQAMADAGVVLETASDALVSLADALDISILGSQPFLRASENLGELARTLAGFEGRTQTLGANLHQNAVDSGVMTDRIRDLKTQVNEVAVQVAGFDRIGQIVNLLIGGMVLTALLTAWVGIAAAFCAWVGWRLRRVGAGDRASAAA